jgi:hypothetical protein
LAKSLRIKKIKELFALDLRLKAILTRKEPEAIGMAFLTLIAILLWVFSIQNINLNRMTDVGLVSVLPPLSYVALFILIISFCLALYKKDLSVPLLLWHVVVLIFFIHGTPIILYKTLRYSWAWKHIGIIDYIMRHGAVDRNISSLSAYHNWPGFFALNAFITEIAGLKSPLNFAPWAPLLFNLSYLGMLLLIFRTFTSDKRLIWLSVWFFFLTNWIGQDYFSPQALSYFFYLVIIGVSLKWFQTKELSKSSAKIWPMFNRVRSFYCRLVGRVKPVHIPGAAMKPYQLIALMAVVILLLLAMVSSHQLTPFMTICALAMLALFRHSRVRTLTMFLIVLTVTWIFYFATPFLKHDFDDIAAALGQLFYNLDSSFIDASIASPGHRTVALMARMLTGILWGLALFGGIRRLRQGYWDLSAILLALAPFVMLAGSPYGGEILFRVYFFALPCMAFFAAALLYPSPASGISWKKTVITTLLSGVLLTGLLFAHFGKDRHYHFTQNEVDAAQYVYNVAQPDTLLIEGSRNYPSQFHNYEYFTYVPIAFEPEESRQNLVDHPVETLSRWMRNSKYEEAYLIITRSMKVEMDATGQMSPGSLESIEQALLQSPEFKVIFENVDAKIFTLAERTRGGRE